MSTQPQQKALPPAAPDPEVVRQFAGWRERLPDGESMIERLSKLDKHITYIPTFKGVREVRKTPFGFLVKEAKEVLIGRLEQDIPAGLTLGVPRLPWHLFAQTVAFFREINAKSKAEVLIRFYFDRQEGCYVPFVPEQTVSGGSVKVNDKRELTDMEKNHDRFLHVFDIHSHNTMSAFWSGVDDADEKQNVRLYGVIGQIDKAVPATKWRMWSGFEFVDLPFGQVVDSAKVDMPVTVDLCAALTGATGDKGTDTLPVVFKFDPFAGVGFPAEWREHVTVQTYTVHQPGVAGYGGHWQNGHYARDFQGPGRDARTVVGAGGDIGDYREYPIVAMGRRFRSTSEYNAFLRGDREAGVPLAPGVGVSMITSGLDMTKVPREADKELTEEEKSQAATGDIYLYRVHGKTVWKFVPATGGWAACHLTPDDVFAYRHRSKLVRIVHVDETVKEEVKH